MDRDFYFAFSATLRIHGNIESLDEITKTLGVEPTRTHRRGERRRVKSQGPYEDDGWHYEAPVPEEKPLTEHLEALWSVVCNHVDYLKELKTQGLSVDIFCGYRSDCDHAGFTVAPGALRIFRELDVPFGVSVIIA